MRALESFKAEAAQGFVTLLWKDMVPCAAFVEERFGGISNCRVMVVNYLDGASMQ